MTELKFIKFDPKAELPFQATDAAACFDLMANEAKTLSPVCARWTFGTGIGVELPPDYVGLVCSRSGLASKHGIFVVNAPGIIDADYQGEIKVILGLLPRDMLWPETSAAFEILPGMRIAQLLVLRKETYATGFAQAYARTTARADGGLGSTGLH